MKKFLFLPMLFLCSFLSAQDCIDESQINPDAICPFIYAPVCGCDAITYSNSCMADAAGVTQYVNGPCGIAPPCADLTGVDFGLCLAVLGIGYQNGSCQTISGCGYIVNDVDYTSYFYESTSDCELACGAAVAECDDLAGVDFGFCDFPLGICNINGTCQSISGCDWVVNDVDYSPFFFENMNDCEACVGGNDCEDLAGVDFGDCEMVMGIAYVDGECQLISGCGFIVNDIDYAPFFFEDELACENSCNGDEMCEDLTNVDFGACAMYMGIAYVNGSCQGISGCGFIVNDIDYSPYFFENMQDCQSNCNSCIDPGLIDPLALCIGDYMPVCGCDSITYWNGCIAMTQYGVSSYTDGACDCLNPNVPQDMGCFDIFDPVCGCDNVTYGNECYAYLDGVTSWTPGECKGNSIEEGQELSVLVYPNPVNDVLNIELSINGLYSLELFDSQGRLVYSQRALLSRCEINMNQLSQGTYVLRVSNERGEQVVRSIVK